MACTPIRGSMYGTAHLTSAEQLRLRDPKAADRSEFIAFMLFTGAASMGLIPLAYMIFVGLRGLARMFSG